MIENEFIMKRLQSKLRALSIHNTAVCNCHKDNRLTDMLMLFQDGFGCMNKSELEKNAYWINLKKALENFTNDFIPHMHEEEEVFQPLLVKYFTYEELRELKEIVILEHIKYSEEKGIEDEKEIEDSGDRREKENKQLPPEILLKIFSHLGPKDLSSCAQVCRGWSAVAMDGQLWQVITPVQWAQGSWEFMDGDEAKDEMDQEEDADEYIVFDEDADIDESSDSEESDGESSCNAKILKREVKILHGLAKYFLPVVGWGVKRLSLAYSKTITNLMLAKLLMCCPNLEILDLTQTRISDGAFKGLVKTEFNKLKTLILSGCENITDITLIRLSKALDRTKCLSCNSYKDNCQNRDTILTVNTCDCLVEASAYRTLTGCRRSFAKNTECCGFQCPFADICPYIQRCTISSSDNCDDLEDCLLPSQGRPLEYLNLSGCYQITDIGLRALGSLGGLPYLRHLDLSGCSSLTGQGIDDLVRTCPLLEPERFSYCDNITDGPLATVANGCQNLSCNSRFCCRTGN